MHGHENWLADYSLSECIKILSTNKFFQCNFSLEIQPGHFTFIYKYHTRHNFPSTINQCWHWLIQEKTKLDTYALNDTYNTHYYIYIFLLQCQITECSTAAITSLRNAKSMTPNSYVLPLYNPSVDWKHVYAITVSIILSVNSSIFNV